MLIARWTWTNDGWTSMCPFHTALSVILFSIGRLSSVIHATHTFIYCSCSCFTVLSLWLCVTLNCWKSFWCCLKRFCIRSMMERTILSYTFLEAVNIPHTCSFSSTSFTFCMSDSHCWSTDTTCFWYSSLSLCLPILKAYAHNNAHVIRIIMNCT